MSSPIFENRFTRPQIAVTVDAVIFTTRDEKPSVVLVQRGNEPFLGRWALPGGFVEIDEDLPEAASRELREETGLEVPPTGLTQLGAYGTPGRDPRMRVVSIVYWAYRSELDDPIGGSDAAGSQLLAVDEALSDDVALAFDHHRILRDSVDAARHGGLLGSDRA